MACGLDVFRHRMRVLRRKLVLGMVCFGGAMRACGLVVPSLSGGWSTSRVISKTVVRFVKDLDEWRLVGASILVVFEQCV